MRLLLAGLFAFGGLLVSVCVFFHYFPEGSGPPSWLVGIFFGLVLLGLAAGAFFLFNDSASQSGRSIEVEVAELEREGLLVSDTFQAKRAFEVEEFEDEGAHYLIELVDGGVLYLNGQYLYGYQEDTDESGSTKARTFPCSRFTVRRHKTEIFVVDIACAGDVLNPECIAPSFEVEDYKRGILPEDGEVIRDRSYDQLKREYLREV